MLQALNVPIPAASVPGPAVRDFMLASVPVITPATSVNTALRLMAEYSLTALPVAENGRLVGIVDERALLRLSPSEATTLDVYEVRALLDRLTVARSVRPVEAIAPATCLEAALLILGREAAEAIPVVDGGRVAGLLTWKAIMVALGAQAGIKVAAA